MPLKALFLVSIVLVDSCEFIALVKIVVWDLKLQNIYKNNNKNKKKNLRFTLHLEMNKFTCAFSKSQKLCNLKPAMPSMGAENLR